MRQTGNSTHKTGNPRLGDEPNLDAQFRGPNSLHVAYYVHHHGRGHATRAGVIGDALRAQGHRVTFLGSGQLPPGEQVQLPPDASGDTFPDADAHGRLHFAPVASAYRDFAGQFASWVAQERPDVLVADVSVEITLLARLLGVPVVVVAQPGTRRDAAHRLGYDVAEAIIAAWPEGFAAGDAWRHRAARFHEVGGISRYSSPNHDSAEVNSPSSVAGVTGVTGTASPPDTTIQRRRVGVLAGGMGWDDPHLVKSLTRLLPDVDWIYPDAGVQTLLATADVVLAHAGQNAIADIAAFGKPAVIVPQERPFNEQAAMASALGEAELAHVCELGADAERVAEALRAALDSAGDAPSEASGHVQVASAETRESPWQAWELIGAAERAADVIASVAHRFTAREPNRTVGIITPVRGRLEHLANQRRFIRETMMGQRSYRPLHIIVAVDMPNVAHDLSDPVDEECERIVHLDSCGVENEIDGAMPTALARNLGAQVALEAGCDLLLFLDVDCVPLPEMLDRLLNAADELGDDAVLNAAVTYLPANVRVSGLNPDQATGLRDPHPARPAPAVGQIQINDEHRLLWSLAFALTPNAWQRCGGFDAAYVGYGAEDTDFGMRAKRAGLRMAWVGGADALHQWHPSANPPTHHLLDIVRNSKLYRERWGVWPMEGWLDAFEKDGLIARSGDEFVITEIGYERARAARTALA